MPLTKAGPRRHRAPGCNAGPRQSRSEIGLHAAQKGGIWFGVPPARRLRRPAAMRQPHPSTPISHMSRLSTKTLPGCHHSWWVPRCDASSSADSSPGRPCPATDPPQPPRAELGSTPWALAAALALVCVPQAGKHEACGCVHVCACSCARTQYTGVRARVCMHAVHACRAFMCVRVILLHVTLAHSNTVCGLLHWPFECSEEYA